MSTMKEKQRAYNGRNDITCSHGALEEQHKRQTEDNTEDYLCLLSRFKIPESVMDRRRVVAHCSLSPSYLYDNQTSSRMFKYIEEHKKDTVVELEFCTSSTIQFSPILPNSMHAQQHKDPKMLSSIRLR